MTSKSAKPTPTAAKAKLRQLIRDPSSREHYQVNGQSWLGHTKGAGKIDEMLIEGATRAELKTARGAVDAHLSYLRNHWKLPIELTFAGLYRFDRAKLGFAVKIAAADLTSILALLGGHGVITKNIQPKWDENYRPRRGHPGDMLDGYWRGQPRGVEPGLGFALHLVEHRKELWLGDYLGALDEHDGFSLVVGDAQCFEVTDLNLDEPAQWRLKHIFKQPGAVTYSYVDFADWKSEVDKGTEVNTVVDGPAYKMAQVKQRLHQREFRIKVFAKYGKRCLVTGCSVETLLEAAHLKERHWQTGDNNAEDGIPLRVDIHRAYDGGLLTLDENYRIQHIDPALEEHYQQYLLR